MQIIVDVFHTSTNDHNGTFEGSKSFQQSKKLWSTVISGGPNINSSVMSVSPTIQPNGGHEPLLTSSTASTPHVDHFSHKVARLFLTGTGAHSLIIDITEVFDRQKEFIVALTLYCNANTHLWAVSELMRRDKNRIYAEILVSPSMYQQSLVNPALQLENFDEPLMAYSTLSPSANIVKLSLSRLPPQYGRQDGGNQQLSSILLCCNTILFPCIILFHIIFLYLFNRKYSVFCTALFCFFVDAVYSIVVLFNYLRKYSFSII